MRLADPVLNDPDEDERRAVIVQEDRTRIVAGAGSGKTHTKVAKAGARNRRGRHEKVPQNPDRTKRRACGAHPRLDHCYLPSGPAQSVLNQPLQVHEVRRPAIDVLCSQILHNFPRFVIPSQL